MCRWPKSEREYDIPRVLSQFQLTRLLLNVNESRNIILHNSFSNGAEQNRQT